MHASEGTAAQKPRGPAKLMQAYLGPATPPLRPTPHSPGQPPRGPGPPHTSPAPRVHHHPLRLSFMRDTLPSTLRPPCPLAWNMADCLPAPASRDRPPAADGPPKCGCLRRHARWMAHAARFCAQRGAAQHRAEQGDAQGGGHVWTVQWCQGGVAVREWHEAGRGRHSIAIRGRFRSRDRRYQSHQRQRSLTATQ